MQVTCHVIDSRRDEAAAEHHTLCIEKPESLRISTDTETSGMNTWLGGGDNRERIRAYIDWAWVRNWLHEIPEPEIDQQSNFSLHQELHDVLVIDILSSCVVQLSPGSPYLTLSHVWGSDFKVQLCCLRSNLTTLSLA